LISLYLKQALPYLLVGGAIALGIYFWWTRRRAARTLLLAPGEDE